MRRVGSFIQLTIDGYFADAKGDMSWAHRHDPEWTEFAAGNAGSGGELLFGRVTYQMMAGYWPTPQARAQNPAVADGMNRMKKTVFSRTLTTASWENTQLVKEDPAVAIRRMKNEDAPDMTILGSGSIVAQLAAARLIDEYVIVIVPVVLGEGKKLFSAMPDRLPLKLQQSRQFSNGNVVLRYGQM